MEKSRGSKKALKAVVMVAALVAALASTGCAGSSLMGPESSKSEQGQSVAQGGGQRPNPGGQRINP